MPVLDINLNLVSAISPACLQAFESVTSSYLCDPRISLSLSPCLSPTHFLTPTCTQKERERESKKKKSNKQPTATKVKLTRTVRNAFYGELSLKEKPDLSLVLVVATEKNCKNQNMECETYLLCWQNEDCNKKIFFNETNNKAFQNR